MDVIMRKTELSDGEWKLMNLLWEKSPRTIGEMVDELKDDTGWSKSTIFMMLKRMLEREIVRVEDGGRRQQYFPLLEKKDTTLKATRSFLSRVYNGSLGMMVAAIAGEKELSKGEIDELYQILDEAKKELK